MTSQEETILCFVSWNTRGIKKPSRKFSDLLNILGTLQADIVFIQETHVGPECILENIVQDETGKKWKVYFTVHNSRSKGVAILMQDNKQFEYICHDEDCSGGYIVLFCRLYGELYTLVNVYNHKADRNVLDQLKDYLRETAEGVLVIGGDFNTVLDPSVDRRSSAVIKQQSQLRPILERFTGFLNLKDICPTNERYTRRQNENYSRIDMFFLPEDKMRRVSSIEIDSTRAKKQKISDHYPLVLKFIVQMQTEQHNPNVAKWLNDLQYRSDMRPGKISGAEILSAIKSLPDTEEHSPDTTDVKYYKANCCPLIETLKIRYNYILSSHQVPENFIHSDDRPTFNVDYLIFSGILAKRLNAFSLEINCDICVAVTFERSPQEIKWSFLEMIFEKLYIDYADNKLKQTPSAPPPEFSILDNLLPKVPNSSWELRCLQPGCPLTIAILNLALKQLEKLILQSEHDCISYTCYRSQTLHIHTHQIRLEQVCTLVKKFQDYSGVRMRLTQS